MANQGVVHEEAPAGATDSAEEHGEDAAHVYPKDDFGGHSPNTVTSLLAAYRGYDTMYETAVIFTAGMALVLLLRRREEGADAELHGPRGRRRAR